MKRIDAVVVGAGQAGLAASYYLCEQGREHIVFEQGRIGESWLSQRWESFRLNTLNSMNALPGMPYDGPEPGSFSSAHDLAGYFQRYVERFQLPVQTDTAVVSIEQAENGKDFIVSTVTGGRAQEPLLCRCVVIASGVQRTPRLPALRSQIPARIAQLHSSEYRNPAALPPGSVLVVGSGQSGCQIVEDLLSAGRTVYLSTSKVARVPRRYRGRDILDWWIDTGFLDVTYDSLTDKSISLLAQPQISGLAPQGHTVSLQHLSRQGAVILGRLLSAEGDNLLLSDEAAAHVQFADAFSDRIKGMIDAYIEQTGIAAPANDDDPADASDPDAACVSPLRQLNLAASKLGSIIWATGFAGDFGWIHLPALDAAGKPLHQRGVSPVPGLYFIGLPWLYMRKSGITYGVGEDARYIADAIAARLVQT